MGEWSAKDILSEDTKLERILLYRCQVAVAADLPVAYNGRLIAVDEARAILAEAEARGWK